jgi:hypothetical protein
MRRGVLLWSGVAIGVALAAGCAMPIEIVVGGQAHGAIYVAEAARPTENEAARELQYHIRRATGTELPILSEADVAAAPSSQTRVYVGRTRRAMEVGLALEDLPPEHYRVKAADGEVFFVGHDLEKSPATMWAVGAYLDRHLGIRWLWPGELGTHVPHHASIAVPADLDLTGGPQLQQRRFRARRDDEELQTWLRRQQMGSRMTYRFGHAFMDWWEKYHGDHADYFAVPPEGQQQPWPRAERVKLNLGNPAVAQRVVQEWEEAGAPANWNVCPNDGSGWCTGDSTRALDPPELHDVSDDDLWHGRANLTPRFVRFWNQILDRMRQRNPDVTLSSYAYGAYREPPPEGLTLEPGMVLGIVNTYEAYDSWGAWHDTGARMVLRPNWWHMGATAPHLPLHRAGAFFRFAQQHSMIGFDFDSLLGYFGTQGPYYYLIARLSVRPELTVDEVLAEYTSAFGAAAPIIGEYLQFWEDFTTRAAYPVPAGGAVSQDEEGLYERAVRAHDLPLHPLAGSWRVLPYLYTEEVCGEARNILDRARSLLADSASPEALRVQFLDDGLRHLERTRDVIDLAYAEKSRNDAEQEDFRRRVAQLVRWRVELTRRHVIWDDVVHSTTSRRGIRTAPEDFELSDVDLEGL